MDNKTFISIESIYNHNIFNFSQKQQERLQGKVETMEKQLGEFSASLPMTYVLREDYIRNQVVLEAKLDNVVDKLTEIYTMESQKK